MGLKGIRFKSLEPGNITLFEKRIFADEIKLRVLTWGDHPG